MTPTAGSRRDRYQVDPTFDKLVVRPPYVFFQAPYDKVLPSKSQIQVFYNIFLQITSSKIFILEKKLRVQILIIMICLRLNLNYMEKRVFSKKPYKISPF